MCIGARFESPRGSRSSTLSSTDSYTQMNLLQTSTHPGYMLMSPNNFDTTPTGSPSPQISILTRPLSPMTSPVPQNLTPTNKDKPNFYDTLLTKQNSFDSNSVDGITPLGGHTDMTDGPPSSPLTRIEIKHLKKYNQEPLVNKSPTIHARRKAEYIDIDLPDTASEGSTGSGSYVYDIPTTSHEALYNVPTHSDMTTPTVQTSTYDVPLSARQSIYDVPPPARTMTPPNNIYNVPSSATQDVSPVQSSSTSPTHRALPHLPTDYENVKPAPKKLSNGGYVNVGYHPVRPTIETGLYMEVPLPDTNKKSYSKSLNNIYCDIPERMESQLKIRRVESDQLITTANSTTTTTTTSDAGIKIAKALEEDGYEFINPATLPALKSPPIVPSVGTVEEEDEDENDTYIEVHRPILSSTISHSDKTTVPVIKNGSENIDFCKVMSRSKRLSDGYEEITDVVRELRERSPPVQTVKVERTISYAVTYDEKKDTKLITTEEKEKTVTLLSSDLSKAPLRSVSSSSSGSERVDTPLRLDTPPLETKLIFEGDVEEYNNHYSDDDDDFEEVSIEQVRIDQIKERSSSDPSSPKRTRAVTISQHSKCIPTALGSPDAEHTMILRKRSSTLGDILLDVKEPKKHTYVNVPEDTPLGISPKSLTGDVPKNKPPMPLPRPQSIKTMPRQASSNIMASCTNANNSNNKVKSLVRQFSDV